MRTAIDLFAGCGGLSLGLQFANYTVVGAVEIDEVAAALYEANHPTARVWRADIRRLSPHELLDDLNLRPGVLDLLAGCPPCQGFSTVRTLNGRRLVDDPRNDLVDDFARFVEALRPKSVMMENVPGLLGDPRLESLVARLRYWGYSVDCRICDASDYGVPQRRKRLIVLASSVGQARIPDPTTRRRPVGAIFGRLQAAGISGDRLHDFPERRSARISALIADIPHNGGSRDDLPPERQLECHRRMRGFFDVYGRMSWTDVAPTITAGCWNPSKGRFLHPIADRAITIREAAMIQGFPRSYYLDPKLGKTKLGQLIGNAFPPEFARRQAVALASAVRAKP